jgi:hypothetical protein
MPRSDADLRAVIRRQDRALRALTRRVAALEAAR